MPQQEPTAPHIIYIAGYGRSGSTLLDRILSQHGSVLSSGEMCNALKKLQTPDELCSCGETISACPTWRPVSERVLSWMREAGVSSDQMIAIHGKLEKWKSLLRWFLFRRPPAMTPRDRDLYLRFESVLFSEFSRSQGGCKYVVDSSKTAGFEARAVALEMLAAMPVRVIHLVRDPRGVLNSQVKGANDKLEKGLRVSKRLAGLRTPLKWIEANLAAAAVATLIGRHKVCRVRYEDLMEKPGETITKLCRFLGIEPEPIIEAMGKAVLPRNGHFISGNRMRLKPTRLEPKRNTTELPWYYEVICVFLCWPLMKLYDYSISRPSVR
ncbi:MAG: sulfotransferase [Syntrophobacteraceae bacterium]